MKDWAGNEVKRRQNEENVAPIQGDKDNVNRPGPVPEEYKFPPRQQVDPKNAGDQYPVCLDCGQRHPPPGSPEETGKYLTAQGIKMSGIRAHEAAEAVEKDAGGPPVVAVVLDKYIEMYTKPGDYREGFIEGLCLGLGIFQIKVEQLENRLKKLVGLINIAGFLKTENNGDGE